MKHIIPALAASALAAAMACAPAHAADAWVATKTLAAAPAAAAQALEPSAVVRVAVALQPRDKAGLDAFVADRLAGRTSAPLTSAQFLARYAPSASDAQAVVAHLRQAGFRNVQLAKNRMLVTAEGNAAAAAAAFHADLRRFDVDGRAAYANVTDAQVPASLGRVVGSVLGLQTVNQAHSMMKRAAAGTDAVGQRLTHDAEDFSTLYGADSLPPAADATIAIVTVGNLYATLNDFASFVTMKGWPAVDTEVVQPAGDAPDYYDVEEWNMDSQASLGAAGGQVKQMLFYDVPDYSDASLQAAWNAAVADNRAQTVSTSIGECEQYATLTGLMAAADTTFEIAIAQGQTFAFASGDSGSWACNEIRNGVTYPASSPWVIAVGGTTLITGNDLKTYVDEKAWSCADRISCLALGGSGGGMSVAEKVPSWQAGIVGPKGKGKTRNIPDVAFDGNQATGLNLFLEGHVDGPIGGTSLSTPIFAGLWARIQSAHGNTLGFPGMGFYGMHDSLAGVFHDVVSGSNDGFNARKGWDDVTGFGSFDAAKLSAFIDGNPDAFGHRP